MELPYRRGEERFEITAPGVLITESGEEIGCRVVDMALLGAKVDYGVRPGRWRLRAEGEALETETIGSFGDASALRFVNVSDDQRRRLITRLYVTDRTPPIIIRYLLVTHKALKRLVYP